MKKTRLFAVLALLSICAASFAQFTNQSATPSTTSNVDDWNTIWVEYNPSTLDPDKGDSQSFTGLSLGYSHAFGLSKRLPFFLEGGLGIQYSFYSNDENDYYTIKYKMLSAKVPVNIIYRYNIPNSKVSLCPFAGVTLRYNISAKEKYEYDDDDDEGYDYEIDDDDNERDLFDKKDMGKGNTWNRFQIGWQIGAKVIFNNKVTLGASYGTDFTEISKKTKINTATIQLGFVF